MSPEPARQSLRSSLDGLARTGERHLRGCGVPAGRRTRAAALTLFDRQLHLNDRLLSADELMQESRSNGFIEAAVEDATRFIERARQVELERIPVERLARERRWKWPVMAVATVVLLAALIGMLTRGRAPLAAAQITAPLAGQLSGWVASNRAGRSRDVYKRPESRAVEVAQRLRPSGSPSAVSPERAASAESKAGPSQGGESVMSKSSKASASSSGSGSDESSPNEGRADESGSHPGSRASADSPGAASEPMSAQQHPSAMSGEDSDNDSGARQEQRPGAGDESPQADAQSAQREESDASRAGPKGGAGVPNQQQSSKDTSRSESQSNSANPGASNNTSQGKGQGGGQDALKKSRGVATMILGVPIPDRVRGLPNPGPVRTLQKKTVPREDHSSGVDAQSRSERTRPLGEIDHPELRAWQKDLLRDYFSQASATEGKP